MIAIFIMLLIMLPTLVPAIKRQFKKPEFTDADLFEDFVCNDFFKKLDAVVPESFRNSHRLLDPETGFEFLVACYYQADVKLKELNWCNEKQFKTYQDINRLPLFIFIGLGGPPHFPDKLYLIPFQNITSNFVTIDVLSQYEVKINQDINFSAY